MRVYKLYCNNINKCTEQESLDFPLKRYTIEIAVGLIQNHPTDGLCYVGSVAC